MLQHRQHRQQQSPQQQQPQPAAPRSRQRRLLPPPLQAAADNVGAGGGSGSELPLGGTAAAAAAAGGLRERPAGAGAWLDALYRFSRPHTMLGTAVSVCSVSALAVGPGQLGPAAALAALQALSSALLMNICIVGINQVGRG